MHAAKCIRTGSKRSKHGDRLLVVQCRERWLRGARFSRTRSGNPRLLRSALTSGATRWVWLPTGVERFMTQSTPDFAISETPAYVGRAVAALAADRDVARWNGQLLSARRGRPERSRAG